jgi:hypothetical protein
MYEVWNVTDLPIDKYVANEVVKAAQELGIDEFNYLDNILEDWYKSYGHYCEEEAEAPENPLDAIEAKLEHISRLCNNIIAKLDIDSL